MQLTLPRFDRAQVLIVGDVMLDRYWHGPTSRISPEAPVPVVKVEQIEDRPGGAANVALNIAALGAGALLAGITGKDEAAHVLRERLEAVQVHCAFHATQAPTITKLRVVSRHQQLLRMDFEDGVPEEDAIELLNLLTPELEGRGALVLSDYAKGTLADPQLWIHAARACGVPVLVDPKGRDFERYRGATLLTPNLSEFEAVVGHCRDEAELVARGKQLIESLSLEALLITRGEHGMTLLRREGAELHLPTHAREVYDVTGAGDTVIAVLAAALASGEKLEHAVALSNIAAGIVVGKLGTATVSAPELRRALARDGSGRGAMSVEQLLVVLDEARALGERIVFTNGCFDILHAGHVGYLEQARQLGDRLIVAVNDDGSVTRLKGPGRPVNPVERRMAVLAGLEAVDFAVSFSEDTPENLLRQIRPDVLVKGGDYTEDQVVGWEIVKAYGGEVRVLDFTENCSTTAIVNRIREQDA